MFSRLNPKQRKNRRRQRQRHEAAIKGFSKPSSNVDQKTIEEAKAFLEQQHHVRNAQFSSPDALWNDLIRRDERKLVRTSRDKYFEAIAYVYAVYLIVDSAPNRDKLVKTLCESLRVDPNKKQDLIALIARRVIDYGELNDAYQVDQESRTQRRRVWSRDAKAIRELIERKVPPAKTKDYLEHNDGLEALARGRNARQPAQMESREPAVRSNLAQTASELRDALKPGECAWLLAAASDSGIEILKTFKAGKLPADVDGWDFARLVEKKARAHKFGQIKRLKVSHDKDEENW